MAKTTAVNNSTDAQTEEKVASAKTLKLVEDIRQPFTTYVKEWTGVYAAAKKLAPAFMRAAKAWQNDTGKGFVHFVQTLDPSVPTTQKGYRDHPVFNRAMYLRGLVLRPKATQRDEREGPAPLPPLTGMVRLIAAIKPLVPEDNRVRLWEIISEQMHWDAARREQLERLVEEAAPLFATRAPRGGVRPVLRIAQPRHHEEEATEAA